MVDRRFWKVMKERQFFNDWCVFLLKRDDFYMVVVEDEHEVPIKTYSSFDYKLAMDEYSKWRKNLMEKNNDWTSVIGIGEKE